MKNSFRPVEKPDLQIPHGCSIWKSLKLPAGTVTRSNAATWVSEPAGGHASPYNKSVCELVAYHDFPTHSGQENKAASGEPMIATLFPCNNPMGFKATKSTTFLAPRPPNPSP